MRLTPDSWLFYAVIVTAGFVVAFTGFKLGSPETITPFAFLFIAMMIGAAGHVLFYFRRPGRSLKDFRPLMRKPVTVMFIMTGTILASNDLNFLLMLGRGAPVSIAVPLFTAFSLLLVVVFGIIFLKEKLTTIRVVGFGFALIGMGLLNV